MFDLRIEREKAGLTQEQLAEKVGLSKQAISKFELRQCNPTVQTAKKFGEVLGFDWTVMFNEVHS